AAAGWADDAKASAAAPASGAREPALVKADRVEAAPPIRDNDHGAADFAKAPPAAFGPEPKMPPAALDAKPGFASGPKVQMATGPAPAGAGPGGPGGPPSGMGIAPSAPAVLPAGPLPPFPAPAGLPAPLPAAPSGTGWNPNRANGVSEKDLVESQDALKSYRF